MPKQGYTAPFNELAVKRVQPGGTVGTVTPAIGRIEQTLRNRVKAANVIRALREPHPIRWLNRTLGGQFVSAGALLATFRRGA